MKNLIVILLASAFALPFAAAQGIWIEAEDFESSNFPARHAFLPGNAAESDVLSGGEWIGIDGKRDEKIQASWAVKIDHTDTYQLWVRKFWKHGPFRWRFKNHEWQTCAKDIALADSVELRQYVSANWVFLGTVELKRGNQKLKIELLEQDGAAAFDCFFLTSEQFTPHGKLKPGEKLANAPKGWFSFEPDPFQEESAIDLRRLNHDFAGQHGHLQAEGDHFVFERDSTPVTFFAVNASPHIDNRHSVDILARELARRGVNMVRIHGALIDLQSPDRALIDARKLDQVQYFVAAMAKQGIYSKLSFYFPLWFTVDDSYDIPGFEGKSANPFSLLFFMPRMQALHRAWAQQILTTPNPYSKAPLGQDPALALFEIQNEDNLFFWTFRPHEVIPAECMQVLEDKFGVFAADHYGSVAAALEHWGDTVLGDDVEAGRVGLNAAWHMTSAAQPQRGGRAREQARFLAETQRDFFSDTYAYLRDELNLKALIVAGNWKTADDRLLGALDKWSNLSCDVLDRHAYFGGNAQGEGASYSVRAGHRYRDSSVLFSPAESPAQELQFGEVPHVFSEYSYPMPNRFRAESLILSSAYGALQGTDAIFQFSIGGSSWQQGQSKFGLFSPLGVGQFPAAALLLRSGAISAGPVVSFNHLQLENLFDLQGMPISQPQNLDDFRKVKGGALAESDEPSSVDPLAFFVGQVKIKIGEQAEDSQQLDLSSFINRKKKVVSSATDELHWDWGEGLLRLEADKVQGAVGFLSAAGKISLPDISLKSSLEYGSIIVISLDGAPLATSERILVQVMSEARNHGFAYDEVDGEKTISNTGTSPIEIREIEGTLYLNRKDASKFVVECLDANLRVREVLRKNARKITLQPDCLYYLIRRK